MSVQSRITFPDSPELAILAARLEIRRGAFDEAIARLSPLTHERTDLAVHALSWLAAAELAQGRPELGALSGEEARDVGEPAVELTDLTVVLGQDGGGLLQLGDRAEQVVAGTGEGARQVAQLRDRGVEGLPVAVEVLRPDVEQVVEGPGLVGPVRAEGLRELGGRASQVVDAAYTLGGGTSLFDSSPLQRRLRDMRTATQHFVAGRQSFGALGSLLVGEEPDTGAF